MYKYQVFDFLRITVMRPKNHPDKHQVSHLVSNNRPPTLGVFLFGTKGLPFFLFLYTWLGSLGNPPDNHQASILVSNNRPPSLGVVFWGNSRFFFYISEKWEVFLFMASNCSSLSLRGRSSSSSSAASWITSAHWVPSFASRDSSRSCRTIRLPWSTIELASLLGSRGNPSNLLGPPPNLHNKLQKIA